MTDEQLARLVEGLSVQQVALLRTLCAGRLKRLAGPAHEPKRRARPSKVQLLDRNGRPVKGGTFEVELP